MKSKIYRISEAESSLKTSGNGSKGLLIIIKEEDKVANLSTLEGLVKAIKFDIEEDVTIVSSSGAFTPINSILKSKNYTSVILIGVEPSIVGFTISPKPNFFYKMEGFSILLTDSLSQMNADKSKKMAFWQNLQSRFLS